MTYENQMRPSRRTLLFSIAGVVTAFLLTPLAVTAETRAFKIAPSDTAVVFTDPQIEAGAKVAPRAACARRALTEPRTARLHEGRPPRATRRSGAGCIAPKRLALRRPPQSTRRRRLSRL